MLILYHSAFDQGKRPPGSPKDTRTGNDEATRTRETEAMHKQDKHQNHKTDCPHTYRCPHCGASFTDFDAYATHMAAWCMEDERSKPNASTT